MLSILFKKKKPQNENKPTLFKIPVMQYMLESVRAWVMHTENIHRISELKGGVEIIPQIQKKSLLKSSEYIYLRHHADIQLRVLRANLQLSFGSMKRKAYKYIICTLLMNLLFFSQVFST